MAGKKLKNKKKLKKAVKKNAGRKVKARTGEAKRISVKSAKKDVSAGGKKAGSDKKIRRIVVAVSGGFDPIHIGHIRMFESAKKLGTELVVIINNDHWLKAKKGYVFMPQGERLELIQSLRMVDRVVISEHKPDDTDKSVCRELRRVRPNIFANGGDRTQENIPETEVCREMGCDMFFGVGRGGKVQSSSWLLEKFKNGN